MEHWECQWLDTDKDEWVVSWICLTMQDAEAKFKDDKAYFYKRIKLRIVHWQGDIVDEDNGSQ